MDLRDPLHRAFGSSFALEREPGRVGMSIVSLAEDCRHQRKVAVKGLRSGSDIWTTELEGQ